MTTILAAAAVVLFAILIGIVVFFFFVYQREELENKDDKNNKIEIKTGPYRPYTDVPSMHPDSCVQDMPFSYKFKPTAIISKEIQDRIEQESNEVLKILNDRLDMVLEELNIRDEMIYKSEDRIEKLEKLIQQLYSDRDEDVNKIADQINRHEEIIKKQYHLEDKSDYYVGESDDKQQLNNLEDNIE